MTEDWPDPYASATAGHDDNEGLLEAAMAIEVPDRIGVLQRISDYKTRPMMWLWQDIVPMAAAVIFAGMGGVSKSTFAISLAGRVTRGSLPGALAGIPSDVIYVSHEDPIEQIVLPRALANGVDPDRFHVFGIATKVINGVSMPKFPEDINALEEQIREVNAKMVIVDPVLSAMASGRDPNSTVDVRELVDPLNHLAQRLDISIVCIAHINKSVQNARTAVQGSAAWSDGTRGTLLFVQETPEPDAEFVEVVFGATKDNYSQGGRAYMYRLRSQVFEYDTGDVGSVPYIEFLGRTHRSVAEVLAGNADDQRVGISREIVEYLDEQTGAVATDQIVKEFASEHNRTSVQMALGRLTRANKIHRPSRGFYQSNRHRPKDGK